jgi:cytosine/adenosine deaminase-related metal-dependent hydrolase
MANPVHIESALLDTSFDARATVRPGAVNAHTHLYSGLVPLGMPAPSRAPTSFVEILELVWWKLDRALDEASLRASARLYVAEALLAGTTTLVDHHESPNFIEGSLDVLAEEAAALGARMLVTYGATERNGGRAEARRGLAECARFVRADRFPLVKGLVGLHASFTVSDDTVRDAGATASELGVPLHVHVAEDGADVEDAKRRGFAGPLERLLALDALPRKSIVAHGVWLDEAAVRRVDRAGAWLVQNPRSNANNRVGYPHALAASEHVAIGTDGFDPDMAAEHAALLEQAKRNADTASAEQLTQRCNGGWRLAADFFPGRFDATDEKGPGDLVVGVPGERPKTVLVAGVPVVRDAMLVRGDLEAIRAYAREQARLLWSRISLL